jgi:uncharacterized protein
MSAGPPTNIIVKVTRQCNLRCVYCHDFRSSRSRMPFETLAQTVAAVLTQRNRHSFRFIWHGGEPLLLGKEFLLKCLALQREFASDDHEIRNTLQTNGCLMDDEVADFLSEHNFTVGISLDGPPRIHDLQRPQADGKPTFIRVMNSLETLRRHGVPFGVLTVLTSQSLTVSPVELIRFYREHDIAAVGFLPVRSDCQLKGETLSADSYCNYMRELFDEWLSLDDVNLQIREFRDWIALALGLKGTQCSSSGGCLGTTFSVEPTGQVYVCDKFVGESGFCLGHIESINFDHLSDHETYNTLSSWEKDTARSCQGCEWFECCAGGCSHDRYLRNRSGADAERCRLKEMLGYVRLRIKDHPSVAKILPKHEIPLEDPLCLSH